MISQKYYSKVLIEMTNKKCQPRLGQKVHDLVTIDMFKTISLKWQVVFFTHVQNGFFLPKFIVKKLGILIVRATIDKQVSPLVP